MCYVSVVAISRVQMMHSVMGEIEALADYVVKFYVILGQTCKKIKFGRKVGPLPNGALCLST
jgi:hypothetical protein